ncbi:MAG: hypothetical protein JNN27_10410 [Planctomycetes bacterium]|nr:hypothetical protein [Planctomycetota bacterium]
MARKVLGLVAVLTLAVLLGWLFVSRETPQTQDARPNTTHDARAATPRRNSADVEPAADSATRTVLDDASSAASSASDSLRADAAADEPQFVLELYDATSGNARIEDAEAVLSRDGVRVALSSDERRNALAARGVASGAWTLDVRARGFHEHSQSVEIDAARSLRRRIGLWPASWVLVRAVTSSGEPYGAIAQALSLEPAAVFEGGFQMWVSTSQPQDELNWPSIEPAFRNAQSSFVSPHYERGHVDPRDVARFQRPDAPVFWVALAFHRHFFGWARVSGGTNVVQFEMAREDVTAQLASVRFCVVDALSEAPLADASAGLDAELAGLRRPDTSELVALTPGCFHARPLIPGEYDLTLSAPGHAELRERVRVGPGEELDLGEIGLDLYAPLTIRVVDERHAPAPALVQLGAWRSGALLEESITPRAHVAQNGLVEVAMPSGRTVIFARGLRPGSGAQPATPTAFEALLVFDREPGVHSVELTLVRPTPVSLRLLPEYDSNVRQIEIWNEQAIVLRRVPLSRALELDLELPPGSYQARLLDPHGLEAGVRDFKLPREGASAPIVLN